MYGMPFELSLLFLFLVSTAATGGKSRMLERRTVAVGRLDLRAVSDGVEQLVGVGAAALDLVGTWASGHRRAETLALGRLRRLPVLVGNERRPHRQGVRMDDIAESMGVDRQRMLAGVDLAAMASDMVGFSSADWLDHRDPPRRRERKPWRRLAYSSSKARANFGLGGAAVLGPWR